MSPTRIERSPRRVARLNDPLLELLDLDVFDAVSRIDLMTFVERVFGELVRGQSFSSNWHLELMCSHLQAIAQGSVRREVINVPPRSLKSICTSVAMVAWMLGHDPTKKIMVVSYGQDLADKLARDTRQVMTSAWYSRMFPMTVLSTARSAAGDFETTQGGGRFASSFAGAVTGRGADLIIIDDPIKPDEATGERARTAVNDYVASTLLSRFNDQNTGAILVVMQRLHEEDLCGHLLRQPQWRHLNLPAIAEEKAVWTFPTPFGLRTIVREAGEPLHAARMGLTVLEDLRTNMGVYHFAAQYQQRPAPFGGGLISLERFGRYRVDEAPSEFDVTVQSWDTANKAGELNDYSVCTTWGRKGRLIYLLAVDRVKMDYPKLKVQIMRLRERDKPNFVLIEEGASGVQLLQELLQANVPGVKGCKPQKDKAMRLMEVSAEIDAGYVMLPREAPWLATYENEFANFPNGRNDDQVDSTTQALKWLMETDRRTGLFRYFAEEARRASLGVAAEPVMRLTSKRNINQVIGPDGQIYSCDNHLVFELPTSVARNLLSQIGWALAPD